MKVIVDRQTSLMRGAYKDPIKFSVGGLAVVDFPDRFGIDAFTQDLNGLIIRKVNNFKTDHPSLSVAFNDEFLNTSLVDTSLSSRCRVGPLNRTAIRPGGVLM